MFLFSVSFSSQTKLFDGKIKHTNSSKQTHILEFLIYQHLSSNRTEKGKSNRFAVRKMVTLLQKLSQFLHDECRSLDFLTSAITLKFGRKPQLTSDFLNFTFLIEFNWFYKNSSIKFPLRGEKCLLIFHSLDISSYTWVNACDILISSSLASESTRSLQMPRGKYRQKFRIIKVKQKRFCAVELSIVFIYVVIAHWKRLQNITT